MAQEIVKAVMRKKPLKKKNHSGLIAACPSLRLLLHTNLKLIKMKEAYNNLTIFPGFNFLASLHQR